MKAIKNVRGEFFGAALVVVASLALSTPARANVTVNPSSINFGSQAVGVRSAAVAVTFTNTGRRSVRIARASVSPAEFRYWGPAAPFYLKPQQVLKVAVTFRPTAAQVFNGTLTFVRANGVTITISLTGTGAATDMEPPSVTTQPANRTVTAGQTAAFALSATGTAPLSYQWRKNGAAISGATSSSYTTPATATSDSGAQFTVVISNSAGSVTSNAATLTVNAATLLLTVNPASLSFGNVNVGSSSTQSVAFTNSGNSNVTISNVAYSGPGFSTSGLASGQILAPGQAGTLNVTFTPSASGNVTGSITVTSNSTNSPDAVSLSGSGVQPVAHSALLSWSPSTSSVVGYQVYTSAVAGGPYTKLTASVVTTPSYRDASVQSGKTYYYVVTAVDSSAVESVYSAQVSAVIP